MPSAYSFLLALLHHPQCYNRKLGSSNDVCGTSDIIWYGTFTIFVCCWTSACANVPTATDTFLHDYGTMGGTAAIRVSIALPPMKARSLRLWQALVSTILMEGRWVMEGDGCHYCACRHGLWGLPCSHISCCRLNTLREPMVCPMADMATPPAKRLGMGSEDPKITDQCSRRDFLESLSSIADRSGIRPGPGWFGQKWCNVYRNRFFVTSVMFRGKMTSLVTGIQSGFKQVKLIVAWST
jgi:hypothetical protein